MSKLSYKHTLFACYGGYIVQALTMNFAPLLYVAFQSQLGLSLSHVASITTVAFGVQILTDLVAGKLVDKIGYRIAAVVAHLLSAGGLILLAVLPFVLSPASGICLSVCLYAVGSGLIEVIISPLVEACPTEKKESSMGLLHSFYCWGCVFVILVSTLLFRIFGTEQWRFIACGWAIVPVLNGILFAAVPLYKLPEAQGTGKSSFRALAKQRAFWILLPLMTCAGATEVAVTQWASAFAEEGLGLSKTLGDLAGPTAFALLMGFCRIFYAKAVQKTPIETFLLLSALGCFASYLLIVLPPAPLVNLLGCGLCGLFVGALWPGTFSMAAKAVPYGGTLLFALLAFAGDLGCTLGPTVVGFVSGACGDNLKYGFAVAMIFPALAFFCLSALKRMNRKDRPGMIEPKE